MGQSKKSYAQDLNAPSSTQVAVPSYSRFAGDKLTASGLTNQTEKPDTSVASEKQKEDKSLFGSTTGDESVAESTLSALVADKPTDVIQQAINQLRKNKTASSLTSIVQPSPATQFAPPQTTTSPAQFLTFGSDQSRLSGG